MVYVLYNMSSQPWLAYWTLHALDLLDALPGGSMTKRVVGAWCDEQLCWFTAAVPAELHPLT